MATTPSFMPQIRTWHHTHQPTNQSYLLSTDTNLVDGSWLNDAFETKDMYWAKRLPLDQMEAMLASSLSIGVYRLPQGSSQNIPEPKSVDAPESPRTPSPTLEGSAPRLNDRNGSNAEHEIIASQQDEKPIQVGYARLITDHITTSYLTDVYVEPASRGLGLAKWLMRAVREVMEDMPAGRRAFLLASPGTGEGFYERELGFWDVGQERGHAVLMTKRFFELEGEHCAKHSPL